MLLLLLKTKEMFPKSMREAIESHKICFGFSRHYLMSQTSVYFLM